MILSILLSICLCAVNGIPLTYRAISSSHNAQPLGPKAFFTEHVTRFEVKGRIYNMYSSNTDSGWTFVVKQQGLFKLNGYVCNLIFTKTLDFQPLGRKNKEAGELWIEAIQKTQDVSFEDIQGWVLEFMDVLRHNSPKMEVKTIHLADVAWIGGSEISLASATEPVRRLFHHGVPLSMVSIIKYGFPFYTKQLGFVPQTFDSKSKDFCRLWKLGEELGDELSLNDDDETVREFVSKPFNKDDNDKWIDVGTRFLTLDKGNILTNVYYQIEPSCLQHVLNFEEWVGRESSREVWDALRECALTTIEKSCGSLLAEKIPQFYTSASPV